MNSRCLQLYRAYSISFNSSNVSNLFWSSILKDCIKLRKRKRELCCFVFLSSTKRAVKFFHVVVVQGRLRNVQKSMVHEQSCCFANINLLLFCHSRRYLSSLLYSS